MKKIYVNNPTKIKKATPLIENKIKIHISVNKNYANVDGGEFNEYTVEKIIQAVDFGFDPEDALLLANDDFNIEYVNIKEHTHRTNLTEIRARVIGTEGKAKKSIETLTGAVIVIHDNLVGIIADSDHLANTIQSVVSLIQGAKHGNVFAFLEKQNANLRKFDADDLGLKDPQKDLKNLD